MSITATFDNNTEDTADDIVGTTTLTVAVELILEGSYAIFSQDNGVWREGPYTDEVTGLPHYDTDRTSSIYNGTITFDGQGGCSWSDTGNEFVYDATNGMVLSSPATAH